MDLQTLQAVNARATEEAQGKHADPEYMYEDWEHELLATNARNRYSARHWNGFIT